MGLKKINNGLTDKQQRFIDYYEGDAIEAARLAGYAYGQSVNLMKNPVVIKALKNRKIELQKSNPLIQSRNARLEWIATQINDGKHGIKNRLKAMEMLQKSVGDYLDVNVNQPGAKAPPPTVIVIKSGNNSPMQVNFDGGGENLPSVSGDGEILPASDEKRQDETE